MNKDNIDEYLKNGREYIAISRFSQIVGVSRQAVYQRLDKDLAPFVKQINGHKFLSIRAISLFEQKQTVNQVSNNCQLDSQLDNRVDTSYVQFLQAQIENLTKLLDQSQQLQALDRKKIETYSNKEQEIEKLRDEIALQQEGIIAYRRKFEHEQSKRKDLEEELERLKNRSLFERLFNK